MSRAGGRNAAEQQLQKPTSRCKVSVERGEKMENYMAKKKKSESKKKPTNDNQNTGQDSKEIRNKTREQNAGNKGN